MALWYGLPGATQIASKPLRSHAAASGVAMAVSQQIAALEGDLKTRLLSRRPVAPTEAGARLLEHAEPILLRLDMARSDVTRVSRNPPAALVVGVSPLAAAGSGLATALAQVGQRMPRLDITVQATARMRVAAGVARGELDLGLTDGLAAPGDPLPELAPVTAVGLSQQRVLIVLPDGHPLAGRGAVRLPDLADARWIAADDLAPPLAEIRRHAGTDGFRPALHTALPGGSPAWPRRSARLAASG